MPKHIACAKCVRFRGKQLLQSHDQDRCRPETIGSSSLSRTPLARGVPQKICPHDRCPQGLNSYNFQTLQRLEKRNNIRRFDHDDQIGVSLIFESQERPFRCLYCLIEYRFDIEELKDRNVVCNALTRWMGLGIGVEDEKSQ